MEEGRDYSPASFAIASTYQKRSIRLYRRELLVRVLQLCLPFDGQSWDLLTSLDSNLGCHKASKNILFHSHSPIRSPKTFQILQVYERDPFFK
jgi:hypothetical protein